jgi:hypothetical protein
VTENEWAKVMEAILTGGRKRAMGPARSVLRSDWLTYEWKCGSTWMYREVVCGGVRCNVSCKEAV